MTPSTAIIIIPLASIAKQQVAKLKDAGIPAVYVNDKKCIREVLKSHYSHVFISPELVEHSLISDMLLLTMEERQRFTHIFVDESHCVVKWYVYCF